MVESPLSVLHLTSLPASMSLSQDTMIMMLKSGDAFLFSLMESYANQMLPVFGPQPVYASCSSLNIM